MKHRAALLLALFAVGGVAGCGSPADNTTFKAPAGWKSTPGIMGRFQMWMTGQGDGRQMLMLVRGDKNMTLNDTRQSWSSSSKVRDLKQSSIQVCGGQRADYFTGRGRGNYGSHNVEQSVEGVLTPVGGSKYFVVYIRPSAMRADPAAESALRSVCAVK